MSESKSETILKCPFKVGMSEIGGRLGCSGGCFRSTLNFRKQAETPSETGVSVLQIVFPSISETLFVFPKNQKHFKKVFPKQRNSVSEFSVFIKIVFPKFGNT